MRKANKGGSKPPQTKKSSLPEDDSFFAGDESDDKERSSAEEEEDDNETPEGKRLRISKEYLASLQKEQEDDEDEGDEDEDAIAARLQEDVLKARGKVIENVAIKLQGRDWANSVVKVYRGHRLSPTCLSVTLDDTTAFTGSKDCSIIRWDVETGAKQFVSIGARGREKTVQGHSHQVLGLSVSSDGNLLASGGRDKLIRLWDVRSNSLVHTFKGHRDAVTCLSFQRGSHTLYSGSNDRQVRLWDCDSKGARETLFGHQAEIHSIDALLREVCVTVAADQSMRLWKIPEDSQLLFPNNMLGVLDTLSMFNDELVLVGGEGGLALWPTQRRQPSALVSNPHGECGVITVKTLAYSNVACSGSWDGFLRLWELQGGKEKSPKLAALGAIPVQGFLNGLHMSQNGRFAVAAVGQEHRLGRWNVVKAARNGLQVISLGGDAIKEMLMAKEKAEAEESEADSDDEELEEKASTNGKHAARTPLSKARSPDKQTTIAQTSQKGKHLSNGTTPQQTQKTVFLLAENEEEGAGDEGDEIDDLSVATKASLPKSPVSQTTTVKLSSLTKTQTPAPDRLRTPNLKASLPLSSKLLVDADDSDEGDEGDIEDIVMVPSKSTPASQQAPKAVSQPQRAKTPQTSKKEVLGADGKSDEPKIPRLALDRDNEEDDEGDSEMEDLVPSKLADDGRRAPSSTSKRKMNQPHVQETTKAKKTPTKFSPRVLRSRLQTPARSLPPNAPVAQSAQKRGKTPVGKAPSRIVPGTEAPKRSVRAKK